MGFDSNAATWLGVWKPPGFGSFFSLTVRETGVLEGPDPLCSTAQKISGGSSSSATRSSWHHGRKPQI